MTFYVDPIIGVGVNVSMKVVIEIRHQDYGQVKALIAPFLEEAVSVKRASLPACMRYEVEAEEHVLARLYDALGRDEWSFDGNAFKKNA